MTPFPVQFFSTDKIEGVLSTQGRAARIESGFKLRDYANQQDVQSLYPSLNGFEKYSHKSSSLSFLNPTLLSSDFSSRSVPPHGLLTIRDPHWTQADIRNIVARS